MELLVELLVELLLLIWPKSTGGRGSCGAAAAEDTESTGEVLSLPLGG